MKRKKSKPLTFFIILGIILLLILGCLKLSAESEKTKSTSTEISEMFKTNNLAAKSQLYLKLIKRVGAEKAQDELKNSGMPFTGQTHLLNHVVGEYIYEKYGVQGIIKCRDYFSASCYHGVIIEAIENEGFDSIPKMLETCREQGVAVNSQCSHALGHGLVAYFGYSNLTTALQYCDFMETKVEEFYEYRCHVGVFMENIWGLHEGGRSNESWVDPNNFTYPCSDPRINKKYQEGCWYNQAFLIEQFTHGNWTRVGIECLNQSDPVNKRSCFEGASRGISSITNESISLSFKNCKMLPKGWRDHCIGTAASASYDLGGRKFPFQICSFAQNSTKSACYRTLINTMRAYVKPLENCQRFLDQYWKDICIDEFS